MTAFLWTMSFFLVMSFTYKVVWLASKDREPRSPKTTAADTITEVAMLVWAIVLLVGRYA